MQSAGKGVLHGCVPWKAKKTQDANTGCDKDEDKLSFKHHRYFLSQSGMDGKEQWDECTYEKKQRKQAGCGAEIVFWMNAQRSTVLFFRRTKNVTS
jgi:hypothetical protein